MHSDLGFFSTIVFFHVHEKSIYKYITTYTYERETTWTTTLTDIVL